MGQQPERVPVQLEPGCHGGQHDAPYLLALDWWPKLQQQDYQFTLGAMRSLHGECRANCEIRQRLALGDSAVPHYLRDHAAPGSCPIDLERGAGWWKSVLSKLFHGLARLKGKN